MLFFNYEQYVKTNIQMHIQKEKIIILLFAALFFCINTLLAQHDTSAIKMKILDSSNNKDLIDVYHQIFNNQKHKKVTQTTKKNNYNMALVPALGYTIQTGVEIDLSGNIGFYTSDEETNLSSIVANIAYTAKNQILLPVQTNIWTKKNKFILQGDWGYYKFPEDTYGLGGYTTNDQTNAVADSYIHFYESILKNISRDLFLGVGYQLDYHWNIVESGNYDGKVSDFSKYGYNEKSISSGLSLNFLYDNRRNSINPEKGFYVNGVYRNNFSFLGSDNKAKLLKLDVRKYIKLNKHNNNVLAFWSYNWLSFGGKTPYLDLPSTGWDTYNNTGRGYVQSRFRGKNMLYCESEYRFGISRNQLLGAVLFGNVESFTEPISNKFEKVLPAVGAGLRIQFKKLSRTNIAIDYAFGANGARGFFINLGEVF